MNVKSTIRAAWVQLLSFERIIYSAYNKTTLRQIIYTSFFSSKESWHFLPLSIDLKTLLFLVLYLSFQMFKNVQFHFVVELLYKSSPKLCNGLKLDSCNWPIFKLPQTTFGGGFYCTMLNMRYAINKHSLSEDNV